MKEIKLTQGKVALVDDEDFEALSQYKWDAAKNYKTFYAQRNLPRIDGKQVKVSMHCTILGNKWVDHIDHNGLNNQKSNLRFCTNQQNQMNRRVQENKLSIYRGVSFHKKNRKWTAGIKINNKSINIGYYDSEIEAARAYNQKAIELFCEFANLNVIQ